MANWLQKNALDYGGNPEGSSIKDVRTDGEGRVWPNADKNGQGGEGRFFAVFLQTSFMDDPWPDYIKSYS